MLLVLVSSVIATGTVVAGSPEESAAAEWAEIQRDFRDPPLRKVVSSAAYNYDRPLVMTECYGGIKEMPVGNLYKEAMDQFAKGINLMVHHAVWYDSAKIVFPPELPYESPIYGPELPSYNRYVGRLQRLLQHGRHVADVGVLYPIATLQAGYRFGVGKPYEGGVIPPEADSTIRAAA